MIRHPDSSDGAIIRIINVSGTKTYGSLNKASLPQQHARLFVKKQPDVSSRRSGSLDNLSSALVDGRFREAGVPFGQVLLDGTGKREIAASSLAPSRSPPVSMISGTGLSAPASQASRPSIGGCIVSPL